jgi:hypothetical protein
MVLSNFLHWLMEVDHFNCTDALKTVLASIPCAREISQIEFWRARGDCKGGIYVGARRLFSLSKSRYADRVRNVDGQVEIRYDKMKSTNAAYARIVNASVVRGSVWNVFVALDDRLTHYDCGPCRVVDEDADTWTLVPIDPPHACDDARI